MRREGRTRILLRRHRLDPLLATAVIAVSALLTYVPAYLWLTGGAGLASLPPRVLAATRRGVCLWGRLPGDVVPVLGGPPLIPSPRCRLPLGWLLGLALGGKTYKLKFGHRGANQPVKNLMNGKVEITVQNHGFCVDLDSLPPGQVQITHVNLNDQSLQGMRHRRLPIFSVRYHPEASAGPHDASYLFDEFITLMDKHLADRMH